MSAMKQAYLMGIDIGTFSSKGVLINGQGEILAQHTLPHGMENPRPGYYEHDAQEVWWHDFCAISRELLKSSGLAPEQIAAVGASTLGCDCLPVDEQCRPLRKAILYGIDARAEEEMGFLTRYYGQEQVRALFGRPIMSGDIAAKILWLKNHEPAIYRKTYKFLTGSSYLAAKLTGAYCIDRYLASAAFRPMYGADGSLRPEKCDPICRPEQLARPQNVTDLAGTVTLQAARETGLAPGTPVITGTGDSCAEAISSGVIRRGSMMLQFGSTLYINLCTDHLVEDDRIKGSIFTIPGTYTVAAGTNTAGTLTKWYRDNIFSDYLEREAQAGENAYAAMAREVEQIPPGSQGLITLPYFAGERSPINDSKAKGLIFGLSLRHSRAHLYRSALEGVGYSIGQIMDVIQEHQVEPDRIMAVGGGALNRPWMQIVADILGRPLHINEVTVGASYGDALMAAVGSGVLPGFQALEQVIHIKETILPSPQAHRQYLPYRKMFDQLYQNNRALMHQE